MGAAEVSFQEAQADEGLLSMLSARAGESCPFEKQPSYFFSVPKVTAQRRDVFSFSEFWSFGAGDRCAAVASAALRGDLEMLKDICTLTIAPFLSVLAWAWRRLIYRMFSNIRLFVSMWSWHFCVPRLGRCGWGENPWKPSTLRPVP